MPSQIDQRRLNDGAKALNTGEPPEGADLATLMNYTEQIGDAIAAMQSLDDLGEDANRRAAEAERALLATYARIKARIAAHG